MSQQNQVTTSPAEAQPRRRRGRPRKDESQASPRTPVPSTGSIQGEGSSTLRPPAKGKESIEAVDDDEDDDQETDEMVGQKVTGVLEYAFDAGYFLSVKVDQRDVHLTGVVFKEGCIVPVTPENDIAPNVKMHKRKNFPDSRLNVSPRVAERTAPDSSLKPAENVEIPQQAKVSSPSITPKGQSEDKEQQGKASDDQEEQEKLSDDMENQEKFSDDNEKQQKLSDDKEQEKLSDDKEVQGKLSDDKEVQGKLSDDKEVQEKLSDEKEMQEKLSDDKEVQGKLSDGKEEHQKISDDKEEQKKLSVGDGINEEGSAETESLDDLEEPAMKRLKTDSTTVSLSNEKDIVQHDAVKSVEEDVNTGLPKDVVKSVEEDIHAAFPKDASVPYKTDIPLKDSSVFYMTDTEQDVSGFQISMENPDDEDELSEPPNDISPMGTEQEEKTDEGN